MSQTRTERGESKGLVAETLRRPIEDAVREGVRDALQEQEEMGRKRTGEPSEEEASSGRGKFALLTLLGLATAFFLVRRRRRGRDEGPGGRRTTDEGGIEPSMGSTETEEATPDATTESRD